MTLSVRNAFLIGMLLLTSAATAEPLIVQGSTTFSRRLLEPFHADIEALAKIQIKIIPNKSAPGLLALLQGRTQIIMLSAPLSAEIELLKRTYPNLNYE